MNDTIDVLFQSSVDRADRVILNPRLWRGRMLYAAAMTKLTQVLVGEPTHVLVSWGGLVYDVSAVSSRVWREEDYVRAARGVTAVYSLGVKRWPECPDMGRAGFWRSLGRVVTRGGMDASNCVTFCADLIRSCGYDVPARMWKPAQLKEWLDGRREEPLGHAEGFD